MDSLGFTTVLNQPFPSGMRQSNMVCWKMIHLAELFFMMFPSKPPCSSGISSPATLTKENRAQISHSFYTHISSVSQSTWLNPPPPKNNGNNGRTSRAEALWPSARRKRVHFLLVMNGFLLLPYCITILFMEHGLYDVL